eukprot:TRINITY_DN10496_c0_g1_i10.p1 TRINITY_DN10496_c0_g1~~TRINITY_DN10496_c0_g1_i10.p1  ORF type:complete len:335 (+),score=36.90 TRINITY_DN10496_c0_g1_i10:1140-2144(+)
MPVTATTLCCCHKWLLKYQKAIACFPFYLVYMTQCQFLRAVFQTNYQVRKDSLLQYITASEYELVIMKQTLAEDYYLPSKIPESWIAANFRLLLLKDKIELLDEELSIPLQVCIQTLKEKDFAGVNEVDDEMWIKNMAFNLDKDILHFSKDFSNIVEGFIDAKAKEYLMQRCGPYFDFIKRANKKRKNFDFGSNTIKKMIKNYAENQQEKIVASIRKEVVAPCKICLQSTTKGMGILQCCGAPLHKKCLGKAMKRKCPHCGLQASLGNEIIDHRKVFVKKKVYKKLLSEYKEVAPESKDSVENELEQLLQKYGEEEVLEFMKKKKLIEDQQLYD